MNSWTTYNYHSKNILRVACSRCSSVSYFRVPHKWGRKGVCPSFWLTSLSMVVPRSTAVAADSIISFFSYGWVMLHLNNIPLHICTHIFYPSLYRWTLRLFPCLADGELCCWDRGVQVSSTYSFVWVYEGLGSAGSYSKSPLVLRGTSISSFLRRY